MFYHLKRINLKRINLWIHVHAVASLVGVVLFLFAPEASKIPLIVGASSYFDTLAFLDFGTVFTPMLIFWVQGLPFLILIFYILFLCKKNAIPYLIIVAIDTLIILGGAILALCQGLTLDDWRGFLLPDVLVTIGMAAGMAVAFFRKSYPY